MDKLEKALEKARRARPHAMQTPSGAGAATSAVYTGQGAANVTLFEDKLEANRIVAHRTRSAEADTFRLLRAQILQNMGKTNARTLAITSANYGDGKTTTALNLSISIAQDLKQTVLLVDLDLRKPCIHTYLGIEPTYGLTDYLAAQAPLAECLVRLPFERMTVLPAGGGHESSSEILGSPQMATLAQELKERYPDRLIIYDMPPLLAQDDPLAFLPHIDAVLLVIQEGSTRDDDVTRSLDIMQHANVIGTVLNGRRAR